MKRNFSYGGRKDARTEPQYKSSLDIELDVLLHVYAMVARKPIRQRFGIPSCVAASYVTVHVLNHFGFHAECLAVRLHIFNPRFEELRIAENVDVSNFASLISNSQWCRAHPEATYHILGPETENIWKAEQGHLVAIAERRWLVDASLDQANSDINQNNNGIFLPGVFFASVTRDFLTGVSSNVIRDAVNGCRLSYHAFPQDRDYRNSAPSGNEIAEVSETIINKVEDMAPRMVFLDE